MADTMILHAKTIPVNYSSKKSLLNLQLSMLYFTVKLESIFDDHHNNSQDRHSIRPSLCPLQNGNEVKDFRKRSVRESHKSFQILNIKFCKVLQVLLRFQHCISDILLAASV